MRLVILFDNFGPYHLARLAATRVRGGQEGIEVSGLETVSRSAEYSWITGEGDDRKHIFTLFFGDNRPLILLFSRIWEVLNHIQPDALAIPGYKAPASIAAFVWAKAHGKITVMMSDSTYEDKKRNFWLESLKRQIVSWFDAALVAGRSQKKYATFLGIPEDRIFLGYDVVDNGYFARGASEALQKECFYRRRYGLPNNYFLTVSRFIEKKNLHFLIDAYRQYRHEAGEEAWDLVLCGSGPLGPQLQDRARDLPGVHFPGFKQADELPFYYGLARCLIMPSLRDTWGLAVNEAMAAGLPELVSGAYGCAPDLVQDGVNGFTFDPYDLNGLVRLMLIMTRGEVDLKAMGAASRKIIAEWTPETFANNLILAVKSKYQLGRKEW
jgi:1,2-diacylglycerol 3-alpha-glucosyltransferase